MIRSLLTMSWACLFAVAALAAPPEYQSQTVNWAQLPEGQTNIGNSHGDIAVSQNGEVYVSVLGEPRGGIQVYAADGRYLRNVPDAPPDFHGFVIRDAGDGEHIYGAQLFGGKILKLKLDGEVALEIPGSAIPAELIKTDRNGKPRLLLTAVDVASDGRIYAVDGYSSDLIHVFSPAGEYEKSFGGKEAPYHFKTCHKIAIDTRFDPPRILCCDREGRRMVHLTMDGELIGQPVPEMLRPAAVAIQGDYAAVAEILGRISLLDKNGETVAIFGENTNPKQTATNKVAPEDWQQGILTAPHGIDFAADGTLFVTEYNQFGRILQFTLKK